MIKVWKAGQTMWVKDPKKIEFWKKRALDQRRTGFPAIKILKEVKE